MSEGNSLRVVLSNKDLFYLSNKALMKDKDSLILFFKEDESGVHHFINFDGNPDGFVDVVKLADDVDDENVEGDLVDKK